MHEKKLNCLHGWQDFRVALRKPVAGEFPGEAELRARDENLARGAPLRPVTHLSSRREIHWSEANGGTCSSYRARPEPGGRARAE